MNIHQLARKYANLFVTKERPTGEKFLCVEDKTEDLDNLIRDAHNGMLPDDYKYQFIFEALQAIAENEDLDDICLEPDCYNRDLLKWVSSNLTRASYVDEAVEEIGYKDLYNAIAIGQIKEKDEILYSVRGSLNALCEGMEDEEFLT